METNARRVAHVALAVALIGSLVTPVLGPARAQSDTEHASVEVSDHGGGRTEADVTPQLSRIRTSLARCREQGRASSGAEVRVRLTVAESGRVTAAPVGDSSAVSFQTCVVGALGRLRLRAGEEGTVDLTVLWHEPRAYGTGALGGFHSRRSSLPDHPRAERDVAPYPDAQISEVVQSHDAEVRHCFASELEHRPDVTGSVEIQFTIGLDGVVSNATVQNDEIHVPAVNECLLGRLATWTFPAPTTGQPATVTHQFSIR